MESNTTMNNKDISILHKMNLYGKFVFVCGCITLFLSASFIFVIFLEVSKLSFFEDSQQIGILMLKPLVFLVSSIILIGIGKRTISLSRGVFDFFENHMKNRDASFLTFAGFDFYFIFLIIPMVMALFVVPIEKTLVDDLVISVSIAIFTLWVVFLDFTIFWYYNKWVESQKEEKKE